MNRQRVLRILQFTVALGALAYVGWLIDWRRAVAVLGQADARWLGVAFALSLVGFIPAALRWTGLLGAVRVRYRMVAAYRAYLMGTFYSLAMPGVIGGDAARVWFCIRETRTALALVATTVLAERALGVVALLLILSLGVYLYPAASGSGVTRWAPLLALLLLSGIAALPWFTRRFTLATPVAKPCQVRRVSTFIRWVGDRLAPIQAVGIMVLLDALTLSILFQVVDILSTYAIGRALGLDLSVTILLVAMPIVYLATVLPISPGGLGVREGTLVIVLAQFGHAASDVALLALTVFLNRVAIGAVGAVQHLASGARLSHEVVAVERVDH